MMNTADQVMAAEESKTIKPFEIRQAMVALELGQSDGSLLDYLSFFTSQIPTRQAFFLHVLPKMDLFNIMAEKKGQSLISNYEINEEVVRKMKQEIKIKIAKDGTTKVKFDVREGNPLEELLKVAGNNNADFAVIGQKSGVSRHGILAKNLARKVSCNALVVPQKAKACLKKILVPIDFSSNSVRALKTAVAINKRLEEPAEIICLNVYEMPNLSVYKIQRTRKELKKMMEADRLAAFDNFISTYVPEDKTFIKTALVEKDLPGIARYLNKYAGENEADFIVMGIKGHSKVELLLMGSVTEKLLSINDDIPTLIVK